MIPVTEWARSDETPPGWKTYTTSLTQDAITIAVNEALEKVASKIDTNLHTNKLMVSRHATYMHFL